MIVRWLPGVFRHLTILRESWRAQASADVARRVRTDQDFLPAALEIMEKPPSPGLRCLMLSLCGLFVVALAWSIIGKVDIVAVASGRVVASGSSKQIQPIETAMVRAIYVRNGQRVRAGQFLIDLDSTIAGVDDAQAQGNLLDAQLVAARNVALIAHLEGRYARFIAPVGTPPQIEATQEKLVRSAVAEYEAQRTTMVRQRGERAADMAAAQAALASLEQQLPLIDQQFAARKELADKGFYSRLRLLEFEQQRIEHIQNMAVQQANAQRARAAMATLEAELQTHRATFGRTAFTQLTTAQGDISQRQQEVIRTERRTQYQQLRAPIDGVVQQLAVATVGGVVQPAQVLMIIVPIAPDVVVEAQVLNRDVGFVHAGQRVRVKLEAYPFADFGLIKGRVDSISRDAIDLPQSGQIQKDSNGRPIQTGLVYAVRIRLDRVTMRVRGRDQPLRPGLAAQVEIVTGTRRVIQYLLSPLARALDEAGRER